MRIKPSRWLLIVVAGIVQRVGAINCMANFAEEMPCCGQPATVGESIPSQYICPATYPICGGYDVTTAPVTYGTCTSLGPFAEMGKTANNVKNAWRTVNLRRSYTRGVVVFGMSSNGMDPSTVRSKWLAPNQLRFFIEEDPSKDPGTHTNEIVTYMVMEEGTHYSPDGVQMAAGTVSLQKLGQFSADPTPVVDVRSAAQCSAAGGTNFNKCTASGMYYCCGACSGTAACSSNAGLSACACTGNTFSFPKPFNSVPALITSIQTTRTNGWMNSRVLTGGTTDFTIGLQRYESHNTGYLPNAETVGWIAIDRVAQFGSSMSGIVGAGIGGKKATSCSTYGAQVYGATFSSAVALIKLYGVADWEPAAARQKAQGTTSVQVCSQEDGTDGEVSHGAENVVWFVKAGAGLMVEGYSPTPSPTTLSPTSKSPTTRNPTRNPTTLSPSTSNPTRSPTSQGPTTGAPTTQGPTSRGPTTRGPTTQGPTTQGPTSQGPTTRGPTTRGPTTQGPATVSPTNNPTSVAPTNNPTTASPTSRGPTTCGPTSQSPTSQNPTTYGPTSQSPTSESPTSASPTLSPTTEGPTTVSPTSQSPTSESPATASPATASPATDSPTTESPATAAPSESPTSRSPVIGSLSPLTSTPTSLAPLTGGRTHSPVTATPSVNPTINPTANPTKTPTSESPATVAPSESPTTESPATIAPSESPATAGPTASPATAAPTESPATQSPVTVGPTVSPATAGPTVGWTPSPTQYSPTCSPLAATLRELKAVLPTTNGTDGVCGQMNRGLTGTIDAGQYTEALNVINNSTARVAALQSAPESCAAFLDFQCDANDNVATTVQRLDTYMKAAFYRLQTLLVSSGGNRNGLSLVQTMTQIVKTTALTQTERNEFSASAGNFTDAANATDLAQTTYAQDIADLLAALIDKNAETAEGESAPMSSNACAAVAKAFERVERLLHKAGTALTVGGSARRLDTSMFESWSSRVDATSRDQLQPSGATLSLPQFSYQASSAASAGDIVVMVALRWKSRVDLCRKPSDLTLESDIYTVSALGDASRMADDVYFATGETMDMTFTARTSSSRTAQRTTGCSGPKECRWWNTATQAWDPSGCTYSETTESCSCTHLTDFAVVAPVVACPEAEAGASSSGASVIIFVLIPVIVVALGVAGFFLYKRHKRGKNLRHKRVGSIASVAPSQCVTMQDPERGNVELRNTAFVGGLGSSDLDIVGSPKGLGEDSKLGDNNAASAAPGLLEDSVNEATSIATEDGADVDHAALFNSALPGSVPTSARGSEAAPIVFPEEEAGLNAPASPEAMPADASGPMMVYDSSSSDMSDVDSEMVQDLFQQVDQRMNQMEGGAADGGAGGDGGLPAAQRVLDEESSSSEEVEPMVPLASPFQGMEGMEGMMPDGQDDAVSSAEEPAGPAVEEAVHAAAGEQPAVVLEEPAFVADEAPVHEAEDPNGPYTEEPVVAPAAEVPPTPAVETEEAKEANPAADILGAAAGGSVEDAVNNFFADMDGDMSEISTSSEESG